MATEDQSKYPRAAPTNAVIEQDDQRLLRNAIGIPLLVYLVLSAIAPLSSVIGYIPLVFGLGNGVGAAGAFLLAAIFWIIFSVGYTRMSLHIRNAGPFYAYISQGLGRTMGISAAYLALVAYSILMIAVYGLFGYGLNAIVEPRTGVHISWWLYSLGAAAIVTWLGYRRITVGAWVVAVLSSAELFMILLVSLAAIFGSKPEGFTSAPFDPRFVFSGNVGIAMMFAFGVFIGFESTVVYSEEARSPRRTVPVATYVGVAIIGFVFTIACYGMAVGWGANGVVTEITNIFTKNGDPGFLFTGIASRLLGGWAGYIIQILFVSSVFAFLIAFHNIIARYIFSLGRSGLLPRGFAKTHHRFHSPHIATLVQTASSVVAIGITAALNWDPYLQVSAWMAALGVLALLLLYVVTSVAVISFFARTSLERGWWATKVAPAVSAIAVLWALVLTVINFDTFVGPNNTTVGYVLEALILVTIVGGLVAARWLRRRRPSVYASAGLNAEETPESVATPTPPISAPTPAAGQA